MNALFFDGLVQAAGTLSYPTQRGRFAIGNMVSLAKQSLPDDPIGTATVTFSGVNAGSEIRIYLPDTTEAAGIETCAVDQVLAWLVYAPGSLNNTVRVVIIHPDYKIKEFNYVSSVGSQSLPVQQERDKWYSNPL